MRVRLTLFGGFEGWLASGRPLTLPTKKAQALLAYLALRPGEAHPRDKLATLLWGDTGESQARSSLRQSLSALRKALPATRPPILVAEGQTVALDPSAVEVDVAAFERFTSEGSPAGLEQAVALYRGDLLEGLDLREAPFEEWLVAERERLRELAIEALAKLLAHQSKAGATERAIQTALKLLALDPLQEPVHRTLMRLYARQGRRAAALKQYQLCAGILRRELGVEPEPETKQLYQELRQQRPLQPAPEGPGATSVPKTRYVNSAGVHIAYQVIGEGPRDLVFIPGFVSHLEQNWEWPARARFFRRLASFSRLILFDKRGTGLSDRTSEVFTLEQRMDDVRAVMDAAGSARAVLFGISEGGPMSILFAATYPERVTALVMYGSYARRSWAPDHPFGLSEERWETIFTGIEQHWGSPMGMDLALWAPGLAQDAGAREDWARYLRLAASPGAAAAVMRMNREIDVRHVLPAVRVPTLVLHRTGDRVIDVRQGRYMAQRIPGAKLIELPGDDHVFWAGDGEAILDEIEEFLAGVQQEPEPDRVLTTVLCLDLLGAKRAAADREGRDLRRQYEEIIRGELGRFRGREIDAAGGRFLAAFDAPARAINCACRIREAFRSAGLGIKAGLHTGECEVIGAKIGGVAVDTGAHVATLAKTGEVLVSQTVKDLVAGSGIRFEGRGKHALEGLPGQWGLFAVV